jgi:hypothetical protein
MPLAKPLSKKAPKAKKQAVVASTLHDLKAGPHHKDRTRAQEIAIAMKQSGQSKLGLKKAPKAKTKKK